jgi:ABC-type oligopeptide transport system substrate-binding subunit
MWIIGWNAEYPDPHSMLGGLLDAAPEIVRDDRVSALLERANALTDPDERWKLYREADRLLVVETVAVFPLAYMAQWFIHRPWVEGLDARPLGSTSLDRVVVRPELRPAHRPPIEGARP